MRKKYYLYWRTFNVTILAYTQVLIVGGAK